MKLLTRDQFREGVHKEGNGQEDRKKHTGTAWLLELLNIPVRADLQVLCYNCNMGREINGGVCPHHQPLPDDLWTSDLRTIKRFNKGCKYSWPDDAELVKLYLDLGCGKAAAQIGCTADSLCKRLNRRGIKPAKNAK